jgi:outer membrane biosynthesis protein TonB
MMQGGIAGGQDGRRARQKSSLFALLPFCLPAFLPFFVAALPLIFDGCTRTHAKAIPESPPLDMPVSPPREVAPSDAETPQPVPLPEEPARNPPARLRPPPAREQPRAEPKPPEPPKPEPAPAEPPKPEEPPKPPTLLQTTPANTEVDLERGIRTTLVRAQTDLNRVDAARLNADARTQYDTAKSFIRQAEAAVRAKNLVFAKTVADKAAVLAAQLAPK